LVRQLRASGNRDLHLRGRICHLGCDRLDYLGKSSNLEARNHFAHRDSGFSTLRRSLGALIKEELRLQAIPRGPWRSRNDLRYHRFRDKDEQRLTDWMITHLIHLRLCRRSGRPQGGRACIDHRASAAAQSDWLAQSAGTVSAHPEKMFAGTKHAVPRMPSRLNPEPARPLTINAYR